MLVNVGSVIGLAAPVPISLYGQVRTFSPWHGQATMPEVFGRLDPRHRTPAAGTLLTGLAAAVIAALLPIDLLGELDRWAS